jgi:hypothetical protein
VIVNNIYYYYTILLAMRWCLVFSTTESLFATCPEVITMSILASSRLSARKLPLEKYRISLLRMSCCKQNILGKKLLNEFHFTTNILSTFTSAEIMIS